MCHQTKTLHPTFFLNLHCEPINEIYANNEDSEKMWGARFWFDGTFNVNNKIKGDFIKNKDYFALFSNTNDSFKAKISDEFVHFKDIKIPSGSQGWGTVKNKFRIFWRERHTQKFMWSDADLQYVTAGSLMSLTSNNKTEMIYLFAILNSKITFFIFSKVAKQEHEKYALYNLTKMKSFIRVPILNSPEKLELKQKLIQKAQDLLESENTHLENLVDFDSYDTLLPQKFEWWAVHDGYLLLTLNNRDLTFEIKNITNENSIYKALEDIYGEPVKIVENGIELNQLKKTLIFDKKRQNQIKKEIDQIVFELYEMNEYKTKIEVS